MNKTNTIHVCTNCDAQFPKWNGRCLECGAWGTLEEKTLDSQQPAKQINIAPAKSFKLTNLDSQQQPRLMTQLPEVDRVFGNGIVPGSVTLLGGEPGIGKSTLVAQIANALQYNYQVVYVSGEESIQQVKLRLDRLNCRLDKLTFITDTNVEKISAATKQLKPQLLIIDSIQTVYTNDVLSETGSLSQIKASAVKFLPLAKQDNIAIIFIGHITKDGNIAGPKSLEHLVDTVIYLETDHSQAYRFLRAVKNRFGSTNEIGIFEMTSQGLKQITNPTAIFLEQADQAITGSVISSIIEGTRPFLVEIQALVTKTIFGYPQRKASGFDLNRLQVLTAVLTKRANINLANQDVILNIVGGLKISDPGLDLAICASIISSFYNKTINRQTLILGEVGLGGEVRSVARLEDKLKEAQKLGFQQAITPKVKQEIKCLPIKQISNLSQLNNFFQ